MNLKAGLLIIPHSIASDQGAHSTDEERQQEPWRMLLFLAHRLAYTQTASLYSSASPTGMATLTGL